MVMAAVLSSSVIGAELKPGKAHEFELPPGAVSETFKRPNGADYFWWDCDPKVEVDFTFADGSTEHALNRTGSGAVLRPRKFFVAPDGLRINPPTL